MATPNNVIVDIKHFVEQNNQKKTCKSPLDFSELDCSICLTLKNNMMVLPDCGHSFCADCLALLPEKIDNQCSLCTTPFQKNKVKPNFKLQELLGIVEKATNNENNLNAEIARLKNENTTLAQKHNEKVESEKFFQQKYREARNDEKRHEKLKKRNLELEARVQEVTAELQKVKDKLEAEMVSLKLKLTNQKKKIKELQALNDATLKENVKIKKGIVLLKKDVELTEVNQQKQPATPNRITFIASELPKELQIAALNSKILLNIQEFLAKHTKELTETDNQYIMDPELVVHVNRQEGHSEFSYILYQELSKHLGQYISNQELEIFKKIMNIWNYQIFIKPIHFTELFCNFMPLIMKHPRKDPLLDKLLEAWSEYIVGVNKWNKSFLTYLLSKDPLRQYAGLWDPILKKTNLPEASNSITAASSSGSAASDSAAASVSASENTQLSPPKSMLTAYDSKQSRELSSISPSFEFTLMQNLIKSLTNKNIISTPILVEKLGIGFCFKLKDHQKVTEEKLRTAALFLAKWNKEEYELNILSNNNDPSIVFIKLDKKSHNTLTEIFKKLVFKNIHTPKFAKGKNLSNIYYYTVNNEGDLTLLNNQKLKLNIIQQFVTSTHKMLQNSTSTENKSHHAAN